MFCNHIYDLVCMALALSPLLQFMHSALSVLNVPTQHCKSRLPCHDLKTLVLSDRHTGAAASATYGNFTSDRIFHSPTDRSWIIARMLVFNDSDTAAAQTYSGNITLSPYSTASMPAHTLCSMSVSSGHACVHCCVPFK